MDASLNARSDDTTWQAADTTIQHTVRRLQTYSVWGLHVKKGDTKHADMPCALHQQEVR